MVRKLIKKRAQYRIQQMVFMVVALLFFFILVGLFFIGYQYKKAQSNLGELQKEQAISFLDVMRSMPEFSYSGRNTRARGVCLDLDKIQIISKESANFSELFPVASIKILKAFSDKKIQCPETDCNYYAVYNSEQEAIQEYETYVCLCRIISENLINYDKCELGRILVGVIKNE